MFNDLSAWNLGGPSSNQGPYPSQPSYPGPGNMGFGPGMGSQPGPYPQDTSMGFPAQQPDPFGYGNAVPQANYPSSTYNDPYSGSFHSDAYAPPNPTGFDPRSSMTFPNTHPDPPQPQAYPTNSTYGQSNFGYSSPGLTIPNLTPFHPGPPMSNSSGLPGEPAGTGISLITSITGMENDRFAPGAANTGDSLSAFGFKNPAPQEDIYAPTLKPYPNFNVSHDCERLRKAMKGMGTDEATIIEIMGHRTADQRSQIVTQFKTMYGKDLIKEFKSELSGHFYECVEALCHTLVEFDAVQLRKAVKGAGTDENALIEILCSRTNDQIRQVRETYEKLYPGRTLEKDIINDTSRHFKRLMVSLLQANRDESLTVDRTLARRDAEELYRAGEKKMGTDESKFNMILVTRSFAHLRVVFEEYAHVSKSDIEKALKSEMSGDLLKSMLAIVRCIKNKQAYFAHQLMKSMKGLGTKDRTLIRLVVSRCEVDMAQVKEEFRKAYGKTLESWITDDTTGDYRKLLLALVSGS